MRTHLAGVDNLRSDKGLTTLRSHASNETMLDHARARNIQDQMFRPLPNMQQHRSSSFGRTRTTQHESPSRAHFKTSSPRMRRIPPHRIPTPQFPALDVDWQVEVGDMSTNDSSFKTANTARRSPSPFYQRSKSSPQLVLATPPFSPQGGPTLSPHRRVQQLASPSAMLLAQHNNHGSNSFGSSAITENSHATDGTAVGSGRSRLAFAGPSRMGLGSTIVRVVPPGAADAVARNISLSGREIPNANEIQDAMLTFRGRNYSARQEPQSSDIQYTTDAYQEALSDPSFKVVDAVPMIQMSKQPISPRPSFSHPTKHIRSKSHGTVYSQHTHTSSPSTSSSVMYAQQRALIDNGPVSQAVDFGDMTPSSTSASSSLYAPPTPVHPSFILRNTEPHGQYAQVKSGPDAAGPSHRVPNYADGRVSPAFPSMFSPQPPDTETSEEEHVSTSHLPGGEPIQKQRLGSATSAYGMAI